MLKRGYTLLLRGESRVIIKKSLPAKSLRASGTCKAKFISAKNLHIRHSLFLTAAKYGDFYFYFILLLSSSYIGAGNASKMSGKIVHLYIELSIGFI